MKQFNGPNKWLSDLDTEAAAKLITLASDVTLVVSDARQGVIRDVAFGSDELAAAVSDKWVGKPWVDTVTVESRQKIAALLKDSGSKDAPRWRMVNHPSNLGPDVPILYAALQVNNTGKLVAFGRSMQPMAALQQQLVNAQQSMEREYLRVRQAEARHRLLFQVASEAVLIVDAATYKVIEVNPAAARLLGDGNKRMLGRLFPEGFDEVSTLALQSLLGAVRATGRTDEVKVRSAAGEREFVMSASLFREAQATFFLIRFNALGRQHGNVGAKASSSKVMDIVASAPEGFVVTSLDGRILFANRSFLDLLQLATEEQARNEPLDRWLGRPGVDFNLLTAQLREHGSLRLFATQLRGEFGSTSEVEICAVSVTDGEEPCLGFTIRDVGQRVSQ